MDRFVWAIESDKGFLFEVEEYTSNLHKAVVFTDLDAALSRLRMLQSDLKETCRLTRQQLPFPRLESLQNG